MDKIKILSKSISSQLSVFLFKDDGCYIAYSPALDLSGYGYTEEEARSSFNVVLNEYFDYCTSEGTLHQDLQEHGWSFQDNQPVVPRLSVMLANNDNLNDIMEKKEFKKYNEPVRIPSFE